MRVKICGITKIAQGQAIAQLGATALGFICVPSSPRYVTPAQVQGIAAHLPPTVDKIGVFANASFAIIESVVRQTGLTGIQLHGEESPDFCRQLGTVFPQIELIKALRMKNSEALIESKIYFDCVDTLLLDAYHPHQLGGTGKTLNWETLADFHCPLPWLLAGGLTPDNIFEALGQLKPNGIDLSSGVERSPGDKDLTKVAQLFQQLSVTSPNADKRTGTAWASQSPIKGI